MLIDVFASGSGGNSYYISDGRTALLLEAGLREGALKSVLWNKGYQITNLAGVFISHEHKDHSQSASYFSKMGIPILASKGTLNKLPSVTSYIVLENAKQLDFMTFTLLPFAVKHDAAAPLGLLLQSRVTDEKLIYATDTLYLNFTIPAVEYIMIEANFDKEILFDNTDSYLAHRIMQSHFDIEQVEKAIKLADKSRLKSIYLLHLSESNSNSDDFRQRIEQIAGVPVYIA